MKFSLPTPRALWLACALFSLSTLSACKVLAGLSAKPQNNEVFVIGTLHGKHLTDPVYTLDRFRDILRQLDPDLVLVEIPPDRYDLAWKQFLEQGKVEEARVKLYPEFTEVLFPIALEGHMRIVPCSAWTEKMAQRRSALLEQWMSSRPADSQQVERAQNMAEQKLEAAGLAHDPMRMHTAAYDRIVAEGMQPYESIFGDDLGTGGWQDINLAHYRHISDALDENSGDDRRVLIIFGAWHKYRLRELLSERDDITLKRVSEVIR
jgi:hypothetical protein